MDAPLREEGPVQFAGDIVGQGPKGSEGAAVDEGLGGGFKHFKTVEGFEHAGARDQDAVVFQDEGGLHRGKHPGKSCSVAELEAEGRAAHVAHDDVTFGDGAGVESRAGYAEGGGVYGIGIDDGAGGGMAAVNGLMD